MTVKQCWYRKSTNTVPWSPRQKYPNASTHSREPGTKRVSMNFISLASWQSVSGRHHTSRKCYVVLLALPSKVRVFETVVTRFSKPHRFKSLHCLHWCQWLGPIGSHGSIPLFRLPATMKLEEKSIEMLSEFTKLTLEALLNHMPDWFNSLKTKNC